MDECLSKTNEGPERLQPPLNGKEHRTTPPVVMVMEVFRWMLSVNIISGLISSTAAWRPFLEHYKNRLEMSRAS